MVAPPKFTAFGVAPLEGLWQPFRLDFDGESHINIAHTDKADVNAGGHGLNVAGAKAMRSFEDFMVELRERGVG